MHDDGIDHSKGNAAQVAGSVISKQYLSGALLERGVDESIVRVVLCLWVHA